MAKNFGFGLLTAIAAGLIGAALLHLVIILSLPQFSDKDAYTRVLAEGEAQQFHLLPERATGKRLAQDNPFLAVSVCGFDAGDGPIRLTAANPGVPFWSLALYDAQSNEIFSINDRTASGGALDVVIATPAQMTQLRKNLPADATQSILVEAPRPQGYAVLRALKPQPSYGALASDFLGGATCGPFDWHGPKRP